MIDKASSKRFEGWPLDSLSINKENGKYFVDGSIEESKENIIKDAFFLDRVSLSIKNGWIDDKGRVFIYYSVKRVCKDLNCGTQKACKLLDELEKAGVLERKRQGPGKPNKLYLKKVF